MSRRVRLCEKGCGRPARRIRGSKFCSPCVSRMPKKSCSACGVTLQADMARAGRCFKCAGDKAHGTRLAATYGITREQYDAILAHQGGGCAICGRVLVKRRYCVDHDHACCSGPVSCGKCVRGLICSVDNKYLGYIRDRPEVGGRITQYLEHPPAKAVLQ